MTPILGYSEFWDKLKPDYPKLPKSVKKIVGNVHHTTIRLNKKNGYYHAGKWQEVLNPRSPNRRIIRPEVEVQQPLFYFLYEIEELAGGDLVGFDAMENGIKMEPPVFRALIESFFGKGDYWRGDYTKMIILPVVIPEVIDTSEMVKSSIDMEV